MAGAGGVGSPPVRPGPTLWGPEQGLGPPEGGAVTATRSKVPVKGFR